MNHKYSKCSAVRLHTSELLTLVLGGLGGCTTCCGTNLSLVRIVAVSRKMKRLYCTCGERRDAFWVLVGTPKGTRPVGTPRDVGGRIILIWVLKEYEGMKEGGDWIDLAQWRSALKTWVKLRVL